MYIHWLIILIHHKIRLPTLLRFIKAVCGVNP